MRTSPLRAAFGSLLIGAGLLAATTSNAAVFRGVWDPSFGGIYPDLGWRGSAEFLVPDACLAVEGGGWFGDGACGDMSMLAASVELFDASIGPAAPTIDTVDFTPTATETDPVLGVFIAFDSQTGQNEVTGVDTTIFGPRFGNAAPIYSGNLWLQFVSGHMPVLGLAAALVDPASNAFLYACNPVAGEASFCESPEQTSTAANVTFQRIPEPATLALLAAGLVLAALVRRRARAG